jgi:hypothetical protein
MNDDRAGSGLENPERMTETGPIADRRFPAHSLAVAVMPCDLIDFRDEFHEGIRSGF